MNLSESIGVLRDRALADLTIAHDYFSEMQAAWEIVREAIDAGRTFTMQSAVTGTISTHENFPNKASLYMDTLLAEMTFQQFITIFENFYCDLLRLWLIAHPRILSNKQLNAREILDAADKDAIVEILVDKEVSEIAYKRPSEWFAYLEDRAKLGCPSLDEVDRFAEAKASRDVLVHNRGLAGKLYLAKAGRHARYKEGERIEIPEPYHLETWCLLRKLVIDICAAAAAKTTF